MWWAAGACAVVAQYCVAIGYARFPAYQLLRKAQVPVVLLSDAVLIGCVQRQWWKRAVPVACLADVTCLHGVLWRLCHCAWINAG